MVIGSAPEIGKSFRTGGIDTSDPSNYEWLNPDGTVDYLQTGEARLCFIDGRPGNIHPPAGTTFTLIEPKVLER